jgi:dihydrofolate reductase
VFGSRQLVRSLMALDLVDELRLHVYPVVVGSGLRLFGPTPQPRHLALREARQLASGVAILIYEAGAAPA